MTKIETKNGIYSYKPKTLFLGIKKINREIAKENLLLFKHIADKHKLSFGLAYGTTLGAIRENNFIEHDEDIDLFILEEEKDILLGMLFELRDNGFDVIRYDKRGLLSIQRKGEYIDFYIFRPLTEGIRECCGERVLEEFLVETTAIDFLGDKFLVPKDYLTYLHCEYGENWRTPIAYAEYNVSKVRQLLFILKDRIKYSLPNFLYDRLTKLSEKKFIKSFEVKVERYNDIKNHK